LAFHFNLIVYTRYKYYKGARTVYKFKILVSKSFLLQTSSKVGEIFGKKRYI
jgi:hypothetical protein